MKFKHIFNLFLLICFSVSLYLAFSSGIVGRTQLSGGAGCNCHGLASNDVLVEIIGPQIVETNSNNSYFVKISGGPLVGAGVNIAASSGSLSNINTSLQKIGNELTHNIIKTPLDNSIIYEFNYLAPANSSSPILYAVGNSIDRNNSSSGDKWNFASQFQITVVNPTKNSDEIVEIPLKFNLSQNYPNPFNPITIINFALEKDGFTQLRIFGSDGNLIRLLINENKHKGNYTIPFNAENLSSGVYFYELISGNSRIAKKMLILK